MASRVTVSDLSKEIGEMRTQQDKILEEIRKQALVDAGRDHLFDKISKHENTLYGDPQKNLVGHESRLTSLEKQMSNIIKVVWIVVTPLLVSIGFGVLYLIVNGGS